MQLEIKEQCTLIHEWTMKNQLDYLKHKNKKIHKTSKDMVIVLSTFNITMCRAFISRFFLMLTPLNFTSNSSKEEHTQLENDEIP
jgi:hypothetical protein